jgi:hypothetical protein
MTKKVKTKVELSISLDSEILNYIKENFGNRSKFIQYCILTELSKCDKYKEKIINLNGNK